MASRLRRNQQQKREILKVKSNQYEIKNQSEDSAELLLYGIIGDYWDNLDAKDIIQDLNKITSKNITVRIFSNGGSVFAGLAIYNALKAHSANITIKIDSLAASIASVIAMAGTVEMPENAFIMIHNPMGTILGGEAEDMRKTATLLDQIKSSVIGVYADKTGMDETELSNMMTEETWLNANEAKSLGFADKIVDAVDIQNHIDADLFEGFKNTPKRIKRLYNQTKNSAPSGANNKQPEEETIMITLEKLEKEAPELLAQIQADANASGYDLGIEAGQAQERERVTNLLAIENADHDSKIQAVNDGLNVDAAYKLFFEAEQTKREMELENLEKETPDSVGQNGKKKDGETESFMDLVKNHQKKHNCSRTESLKAVAAENPALHASFLEKGE